MLGISSCLECGELVARVDPKHLRYCCGLTMQEYAIRHNLPLDLLVDNNLLNKTDSLDAYMEKGGDRMDGARCEQAWLALRVCGKLCTKPPFVMVHGQIRCLDQLLWLGELLATFGFKFRQEYTYDHTSHRVIASNVLKAPDRFDKSLQGLAVKHLSAEQFCFFLSVLVAVSADYMGGYIFLPFTEARHRDAVARRLYDEWRISVQFLASCHDKQPAYLRLATFADNKKLLEVLSDKIKEIPQAGERFYSDLGQDALVTKTMDIDSAHFITDHPKQCSNMHGGRYTVEVSVRDRIDPHSGFVVDYGYLKCVMQFCVETEFDHKTLNYCSEDLTWRSSTELVAACIWVRLLPYLPNLHRIRVHETATSYTEFRGCSLDALNNGGCDWMPAKYFGNVDLGKSPYRRGL